MNPENNPTSQSEIMHKEIKAPEKITEICQAIEQAEGQCYIVGGWVRDQLLSNNSKPACCQTRDIDLEIFGLKKEQLEKTLQNFGLTKEIGKSFAVYKIDDIDVALARLETKTGPRHTDFEVKTSPDFTPEQTSRRRDFTVNALMYDPLKNKVLDFHNGLPDLDNKTLRLVDEKTFTEDPLRVYRLASLSSRLGFEIEPTTFEICRQMVPKLKHLPKERVGEEWKKIMLAPNPSQGLEILEKLGVLKLYFPEIDQMVGARQDPIYHPEGDVWTHTLLAINEGAKRTKNKKNRLSIMLAILVHDIGKPSQTEQKPNGRISHYKHESRKVVEPLIHSFLNKLNFSHLDQDRLRHKVVNLVCDHMTIIHLTQNMDNGQVIDRSLRRLSSRLRPATLRQLIDVGASDHKATRGEKDKFKGEALLKRADELAILDNQPQPILTGRDLIDNGLTAGPKFGEILRQAYNDQLDGKINSKDEALQWLKSYLQS